MMGFMNAKMAIMVAKMAVMVEKMVIMVFMMTIMISKKVWFVRVYNQITAPERGL